MSNASHMQNLFAGASELPAEKRAAYLDAACRGDAAQRVNQPVWPWLIAGALAVVMVEWWIYNRRVML